MVDDTTRRTEGMGEGEVEVEGYSPMAFLAPLFGVLLGLAALLALARGLQSRYAERICPRVTVGGVAIGGLALPEARATLERGLSGVDGALTLSDGQMEWDVPWSALGMAPDIDATLEAAFAIGHELADRDPRRWVRVWLAEHALEPALAVNAIVAREALATLDAGLYRAAVEGTLRLDADRVVVVPGVEGRSLDVDGSLEAVIAAAQRGDGRAQLAFHAVPATVPDPRPTQEAVDALLARRVEIASYDPVEDKVHRWVLGRAEMTPWLVLDGADPGASPTVRVEPAAVADTLQMLAAELGEGRGFRQDQAPAQVLAALEAGGGAVTLYMTHPERRYTVQAGDTALLVAARHGMPLWPLAEANPGVDLDALHVGDELIIPSQDVLTPSMPVPGKRIIIDISDQRMWVYENGAPIHEWVVSTGREGSPTHVGVFQVLSKERDAYASLWDLRMPDFIGLYASGPGFTNGIHALPILANGQRLWAGTLGAPASYGCIILGVEEASALYAWVEIGVTVEIRA